MKKLFIALLAVITTLTFTACDNSNSNGANADSYCQVSEAEWKKVFQDSGQSTNYTVTITQIQDYSDYDYIMKSKSIFKADGNLFYSYYLEENTEPSQSKTFIICNPQTLTIDTFTMENENSKWKKESSYDSTTSPNPQVYYNAFKNEQNLLYSVLLMRKFRGPTYTSLNNLYKCFTFDKETGLYTACLNYQIETMYDEISIGIKGGKVVYFCNSYSPDDNHEFKYEIEYGNVSLTVPPELENL